MKETAITINVVKHTFEMWHNLITGKIVLDESYHKGSMNYLDFGAVTVFSTPDVDICAIKSLATNDIGGCMVIPTKKIVKP